MRRCSIGERSDEPCPNEAKFHAERWGVAASLDLCEPHAHAAIADGWSVTDDASDEVLPHPETGELAKVVTIEVCT